MFINNELLVIAFIPRSGSNFLCDMLRRTSLAAPLEYYYPYEFEMRREAWNAINDGDKIDMNLITNAQQWFEYVVGSGAVKTTWQGYSLMLEEAGELIDRVNMKFVYLRRHDKLRQAISWLRAEQSGIWTSLDQNNKGYCYNRELIQEKLIDIIDQETRWNKFFENTPHINMFYEDLDYNVISDIEKLLGRDRPHDYWDTHKKILTQYNILRDDETERWVQHFLGQ